jgi:predicted alpha/beta-hydrolase family hydrolase
MSTGQQAGIDGDQCAQLAQNNGWLWNQALEDTQGKQDKTVATLILAHGAGAPMDSEFMNDMAARLAAQGVNVLRFEFAYMAQRRVDGRRRPPNPQAQLLDCLRQVYASVRPHVTGCLAIGGKSMGGRMASLIADELEVDALVCLGYPFYAAGKPEKPRVAHLAALKTRTLVVQGERDALGNRETVEGYALSPAIDLMWVPAANHDLKPLKSAGVSYEQCLADTARRIAHVLA